MILPRQARDKHRESTQTETVLSQDIFAMVDTDDDKTITLTELTHAMVRTHLVAMPFYTHKGIVFTQTGSGQT